MGIFDTWDEIKRKAVRGSDRKHLFEFQRGKCGGCKKSFKQMGVRHLVHHKNLNPKDNRIVNLILVCPNCHDKIHQKEKKVRKKVSGGLFPEYRVVKVKTKSKPKKKTTKKKASVKKKTTKRKKTTKKPTKKKTTKRKTTKKKTIKKKTTKTKKKTTKRKTSKKKTIKKKTKRR